MRRPDESIEVLEQASTPSHRGGFIHGALGWALAVAGRTDDARGVLRELKARPAPAPAVISEAWLLAALGDTELAWNVMKRGDEERQAMRGFAGLSGFDPLRADPRFPALLERLGLPTAAGRG